VPSKKPDPPEGSNEETKVEDTGPTELDSLTPASTLESSGALEVFGLGDEIQVATVTFTLRAPTNPEIALFQEISERHRFEEITTEAAALMSDDGTASAQAKMLVAQREKLEKEQTKQFLKEIDTGKAPTKREAEAALTLARRIDDLAGDIRSTTATTSRERFIWAKIGALEKESLPLENKSIEGKTSDDEEARLFEILTEIDALTLQATSIRQESTKRQLLTLRDLYDAAHDVYVELTYHLATADGIYDGTPEEWAVITKDSYADLENLVTSMGFRNPMSGLTRAQVPKPGVRGTSRRSRRARAN
jgi:hypothetical protein